MKVGRSCFTSWDETLNSSNYGDEFRCSPRVCINPYTSFPCSDGYSFHNNCGLKAMFRNPGNLTEAIYLCFEGRVHSIGKTASRLVEEVHGVKHCLQICIDSLMLCFTDPQQRLGDTLLGCVFLRRLRQVQTYNDVILSFKYDVTVC